MEPEELAELFGPYVIPSRPAVNAAARGVIAAGGEVLEGAHRAQDINDRTDPEGLREMRTSPIGTRFTCACGEVGVAVELPPSACPVPRSVPEVRTHLSRRPLGTTHLCIRCDAVHLMPRFAE